MDWRRTIPLLLCAGTAGALASCDLPPGFNEVEPGEGPEREVGTADFSPVPEFGFGAEPLWNTDFVGWQIGGSLNCAGTVPGGNPATGGGSNPAPVTDPIPIIVQIWDGVEDPCGETLDEGDRVLQIELSDVSAGTYNAGIDCVGPRTARITYGKVIGGRLFTRTGVEGTVSVIGVEGRIDPEDETVIAAAFNVRFGAPISDPGLGTVIGGNLPAGGIPPVQGQTPATGTGGFSSGGFRGIAQCF